MARDLNGSTQYLTIADHADLTLPDGDWSFAFKYRMKTATSTARRTLFSAGAWGATPTFILRHDRSTATKANTLALRVRDNDGTLASLTSSDAVTDTDWHSVTLVRSGSTVTMYLDGASQASSTNANLNGVDPAVDLNIGRQSTGASYTDMHVAEIAKWDRALSDDQVAAYANGVVARRLAAALRFYLPLAGIASPEPDLSGRGHHATLVNAPPASGFAAPVGFYTAMNPVRRVVATTAPPPPADSLLERSYPRGLCRALNRGSAP